MAPNDRWVDREAGRVVRPYALTGGRTDPAGGAVLDLITVIVAYGPPPTAAASRRLGPEHRKLIGLCQEPMTVADAAADVALPLGVVRVLLADLIQQKLITVQPRRAVRPQASPDLLREVLNGLRSL
ncbi:MAG: DUF742 domain-containing protein [Streptosporangiaceae bacterium]